MGKINANAMQVVSNYHGSILVGTPIKQTEKAVLLQYGFILAYNGQSIDKPFTKWIPKSGLIQQPDKTYSLKSFIKL